jgi:hypothetical protein
VRILAMFFLCGFLLLFGTAGAAPARAQCLGLHRFSTSSPLLSESTVDWLSRSVSDLANQVKAQNDCLDEIESDVGYAKVMAGQHEEKVTDLETRLSRIERSLEDIENRLKTTEELVNDTMQFRTGRPLGPKLAPASKPAGLTASKPKAAASKPKAPVNNPTLQQEWDQAQPLKSPPKAAPVNKPKPAVKDDSFILDAPPKEGTH